MGVFRRADDPDQGLLLPPSPRDWLPQGHLAWFIQDTVAQLNIDELVEKYRVCGKGELPYPPRTMLQVLIYAYATGVFSSRRIAAQIEDSIAFRVLAGGLKPSHRTICRFREEHLDAFHRLFQQVVQVAMEAGLVKMGMLVIDGSKVKANASKHKAMSFDRMEMEAARLREEIAKLTRAAAQQDELDDAEFGPNFRGDELPAELSRREERLAKIIEAKKRLEERKAKEAEAKRAAAAESDQPAAPPKAEDGKPKPRDQENFTDPDSRIMPTGKTSFEQSYNAQIAVDATKQIIVGTIVTQSTNDNGHLMQVLDAAVDCTKQMPAELLADAGYKNERDFQKLDELKIDAYVATGREGKPSKKPIKLPYSAAMNEKVASESGREKYRRRKAIVEPVFGWVKSVLGFRAFKLRGLRKVAGEWKLVCMALNLRRMAVLEAR